MNITVVDYGAGNLHSVIKKLKKLNVNPVVANKPEEILKADKLILPGVGHFANAMKNLEELNLIEALNQAVLKDKKPILGICLGMQLMALYSEEGGVVGLGWVNAVVKRFTISDKLLHKVPHTGWNNIHITKSGILMERLNDETQFYFVHAYHVVTEDKSIVLNETTYEYPFVSAIQSENIFGVQYHPEKSHEAGERLFSNFIKL